MLSLTIELEGTPETFRTLRQLGINLSDFSRELKDTGTYMRNFIQTNVFATEGQIIGEPWAPLNPAYQAWKQVHFPGRGTLERSGTMRGNFRFNYTGDYMRLWNPTPYFLKHQLGRERMPRRVMMKIDEARRQAIIHIFERSMRDKVRRAIG